MAKVKQLWREMSPAEQANYGIENNAQIVDDIDFDEPMYEPAPKMHRKEKPVSYYVFLNKNFAIIVTKKNLIFID